METWHWMHEMGNSEQTRQRRPNVHTPFAWPSTSQNQRRRRNKRSPGRGTTLVSNPSTQTSVGGLTSSAAAAGLVPPTRVASTVKARGRTQRVARTVLGTSCARGWSILLLPVAVKIAAARRGDGRRERTADGHLEHVPGAEEDRRRAVQRGVDLGKPGRPAR